MRALTPTGIAVEDLASWTLFLDAHATADVLIVPIAIRTGGTVLGTPTLTSVVIVFLALGTCGTRVGALTLAHLLVEVLSEGAVLLDTDATTCVLVVPVPVGTSGRVLGTPTLTGVVIIHLTLGAVGSGARALASAVLLVEDLSSGTRSPDAHTATCARTVIIVARARWPILGTPAFARVVVVHLAPSASRAWVGAFTSAGLAVEDLSCRTVLLHTNAAACFGIVAVTVGTIRTLQRTPALADFVVEYLSFWTVRPRVRTFASAPVLAEDLRLGTHQGLLAHTATRLVTPRLPWGTLLAVRTDAPAEAVAIEERGRAGVSGRGTHTLAGRGAEHIGAGAGESLGALVSLALASPPVEVVWGGTSPRLAST